MTLASLVLWASKNIDTIGIRWIHVWIVQRFTHAIKIEIKRTPKLWIDSFSICSLQRRNMTLIIAFNKRGFYDTARVCVTVTWAWCNCKWTWLFDVWFQPASTLNTVSIKVVQINARGDLLLDDQFWLLIQSKALYVRNDMHLALVLTGLFSITSSACQVPD